MRTALLAVIVLAACSSPETQKARQQASAQVAVSAESAKASLARVTPSSGRWDDAHLVDRLVRAGLAPQADTGASVPAYWGAPVAVAYQVGAATLFAYIFPDSAARRRATAALDPVSLAPKGAASPYAIPRLLIQQNNLAAVLVGGSDRQQERVQLALTAGLPVTRP